MSSAEAPAIVTGVDFVSVPTQDLDRAGNALLLHHRYAPRVPDA
jgi:hypothetical protein